MRQCLKNRHGYGLLACYRLEKGEHCRQVEEEGEHDQQMEQEGENSQRYIPPNMLLLPPFVDTVVPYAAFETNLCRWSWL